MGGIILSIYKFEVKTKQEGFTDITYKINSYIEQSNVKEGICVIYTPHTTAAITINENADPDVVDDLLFALDKIYPQMPEFKHLEGNSPAHLKSSCIGVSETVIIENSKLLLGTWQGIYLCEFDGPRTRKVYLKIIK